MSAYEFDEQEWLAKGEQRERERIIKLLEARCLWLIHIDLLAEAEELRTQIALIKGEQK